MLTQQIKTAPLFHKQAPAGTIESIFAGYESRPQRHEAIPAALVPATIQQAPII